MTIYTSLIAFFIALFFTACNSTPNVPLSPELDQYALVKENCEGLRTIPGINVPDALDKECRTFLQRLDKANAIDYKVAHFNDDNTDPNAKPKPEYIRLQTDAYRQHRKAEVEYQMLCDTFNHVSLKAITHNQLSDVELTLTFPETEFTKKHYDYYKEQAPQYREDPQYIAFEKRYAKDLVKQGLVFLSQGDKKRANKAFKTSASLNNAQAEYLVGIVYEAKHIDKAIEWHTKAKEHGIKGARINLARLYSRKHEPKEAQKLYIEAAEDGDAYAQYLLYEQYKKTDNTKTNAMAHEWVKRSAENGFPPAEYAYAQLLLKEKRDDDAKEWLIKAHEHGISAANASLGALYFDDKNYEKAVGYLSAAQSGYAKFQLAQMYERGLGVETDFYRSYMLYKEALKLGQKNAKKDVARLAKLKTGKEEAHYDAEKRNEKQRQKALTQRNGEESILRNLRTKGMQIHLQGLVSLPLQTSQGFIVNSEDGKQFYVIDAEQKANVRQYQYVDITTIATGNSITVSSSDGLTVDIYQLYFLKHTQQ
ncbi:MAG: tetratricopeptide repeat protein [Sulfurimonadaceae bacterium]